MRRDETKAQVDEPPEDGLGLGDIVAMLRRRFGLIATVTTILTAIAVVVVLVWPNRYEAIAVVQLDPRPKKVTRFDNVYEDLKPDTPTIESEAEIAISGPVLRAVMTRLGLTDDPELTGQTGTFDEILRRLGFAVGRPAVQTIPHRRPVNEPARPGDFEQLSGARGGPDDLEREPVFAAFNDRVSARRLRNTQLIEIRYSSRDPVKAARVATTIAETYILAQITSKREASEVANAQIEKRIVELRRTLAGAERDIEQLKSRLGVFQAQGGELTERQLAREMESLVEARRRTAEAAARHEAARRALAGGPGHAPGTAVDSAVVSIPEIFRSPTMRALAEALEKAERHAEELRIKYGHLHPVRQRAEADSAAARAALIAELANIVATARAEHAIAEESERQLDGRLDTLKREISRVKAHEWQLKALEREAKSTREIYEHLLSRRKQMAESADLQIADARVIDRATVPLRPASPKRKQIVLVALVGALLAGIGLALALELLNPGISSPAHTERDVDLALIAAVPRLADARQTQRDLMEQVRTVPLGAFAESVREIRLALDDGRPPGRQLTVMLASALPGEGKSVIAANLAAHYAASPGRTLLIDADMRRGTLTRHHRTAPSDGLYEVLAGRAAAEDCIRQDGPGDSWFLPSSRMPDFASPASELLASPVMTGLMAQLAAEFDTILIDAPPILPVVDSRILAHHVDDIVIVATVRKTPKEMVRRALKALAQNGSKVLGIVVNGIDRSDRYRPQGYTSESSTVARRAA